MGDLLNLIHLNGRGPRGQSSLSQSNDHALNAHC